MKKLILILILFPIIGFGQNELNDFKYLKIEIENLNSNEKDFNKFIFSNVLNTIESHGIKTTLYGNVNHLELLNKKIAYSSGAFEIDLPRDVKNNDCLVVTCLVKCSEKNRNKKAEHSIHLDFIDCNGNIVFSSSGRNSKSNWKGDYKISIQNAFNFLNNFNYSYDETSKNKYSNISIQNKNDSIAFHFEDSLRSYFDINGTEHIEGIWQFFGQGSNQSKNKSYKIAIVKTKFRYNAYMLDYRDGFQPFDLRASIETTSDDNLLAIDWKINNDRSKLIKGYIKQNNKIEFQVLSLWTQDVLHKVYPNDNKRSSVRKNNSNWTGNGSGIIISRSGYIVTNYHVIENSNEIEIEFILNGEIQKLNAEVISSDKINDLGIIKIDDNNFKSLKNLSYNFKIETSDVGTKVYAFGYPMALSIMGKEMKVTDGIISAKTGFNGDITRYQITAPIQGGNSGGPLFDDKGNLIAINSSKIRNDIADNVGYSIKSSYVLNLIDVLPNSIELPSSKKLYSMSLTDQIKEISKYVVLVKVK